MKKKLFVFASFVLTISVLGGCESMFLKPFRGPASTEELIGGSQKILSEVSNERIFNEQSCSAYIERVTEYLYELPANHFVPQTSQEVKKLIAAGPEVMDTLFQIRTKMHENLQRFASRGALSPDCVLKMREGFQYSRFAEEYLLDWLISKKVYHTHSDPILENSKPSTWVNSKFEDFKLQSGDVMLIRGKSYVSAMIARIGDEEGNFSHLALIGEDKKGNKFVIESLIQYGVIVTSLEKWRQAQDARVALYRYKDKKMAQRAARAMYDYAKKALDSGSGIRYDFKMDDSDYSSFFCSEVIRYAFDKASNGAVMIPQFRSTIKKFAGNEYPKSLGVTGTSLFAPYDVEVDPRFDFVAEYRYIPLLRQVRMQDAVLQSVYSWMITKDYKFDWNFSTSTKASLAKILRDFGLFKSKLPSYMPLNTVQTTMQFEAVATVLEKNLYAREQEFYLKKGYLPSFQDMLEMNEEYRLNDCQKYQKRLLLKPTEFHDFFNSDSSTCD